MGKVAYGLARPAAVEQALAQQHVPSPALDAAGRLRLLEHVLTLIAFQLMLERNYNGQVEGTLLQKFEHRCKDRWFHELDTELAQLNLTPRKKLELEQQVTREEGHWNWALAVLKTIALNHRTVTEAHGAVRLAFRSRKMVEFHAARYLTRYATAWDVFGNDDRDDMGENLKTRCAWDFTNDLDWKK